MAREIMRLRRLIERLMMPAAWDLCPGCSAELTPTDIEAGYCTQCTKPLKGR